MSKILITGALGAVGTPLTQLLLERGHDVWGCDLRQTERSQYVRCDVGEYRQLDALIRGNGFDYVYHTAAEFGRVNGEENYEALWRTNVVGTKHLIRLQEATRFRLVVFSSSEIYGDWPDLMTEDVPDRHALQQMNDYAISKWVNELQVKNSQARFGTETVRVRLFNTYGPGEYYSPYRSVICLFVYRALHDLPYEVYLDHRRTSTYIDDCVRTLANIADNFKPGAVYNVAGDDYHDIKSVSDTILRILGKSDDLVSYIALEQHNARDKRTDPALARQDLDHRSTVDLDEGIRRTIEWQRRVYGVGLTGS
jgi:dTDP-glucose 4,6-dehydratase